MAFGPSCMIYFGGPIQTR